MFVMPARERSLQDDQNVTSATVQAGGQPVLHETVSKRQNTSSKQTNKRTKAKGDLVRKISFQKGMSSRKRGYTLHT